MRGVEKTTCKPVYGRDDVELAGCLVTAEAIRGDRVATINTIANLTILELNKRIESINAHRRKEIALAHKKCRDAKRLARAKYPGAVDAKAIGKSGKCGKRNVTVSEIAAPMPDDGANDPNADLKKM